MAVVLVCNIIICCIIEVVAWLVFSLPPFLKDANNIVISANPGLEKTSWNSGG